VLHEKVMFVTVQTTDRPEEPPEQRATIELLAPGIHRVVLRYGFMESPNIPRALEDLGPDSGFDSMQASIFWDARCWCPAWRRTCRGGAGGCFCGLRARRSRHGILPHPQRSRRRTGRSRNDLERDGLRTKRRSLGKSWLYFNWSATLSRPACTHGSSTPGEPEAPTPPMISEPDFIGRPPGMAMTFGNVTC